ncbi:MAG: MFS transporter permease [Desulfobacteraceae bacterium]|nr:MFS transporter permease [Desulfobacteraceae bacterium]
MNPNDDRPTTTLLHEVAISKEKAVFWMDGRGRWHNRHGRFEHKRIIDHFNRSIRRDEDGYYVTQMRGDVLEKVYFPYEDTPLFIVRVSPDIPLRLDLNTGETIPLDPAALFVESDQLYHKSGDARIKFTDRALLAISPYLEERADGLSLCIGDHAWPIADCSSSLDAT